MLIVNDISEKSKLKKSFNVKVRNLLKSVHSLFDKRFLTYQPKYCGFKNNFRKKCYSNISIKVFIKRDNCEAFI